MIISTAILLLILTPIFLSIVVSLPLVQNRILIYATKFATEFMQSEVSIGRIDVTMSGGVEVSDFLVRDLDRDTLLYVKRLNSRISGYSNKHHTLSLGQSKISGAKLRLQQSSRGRMNITEVTERLSTGRGDGQFIVAISNAKVEDMILSIDQNDPRSEGYGVDLRHLLMNDLKGEVNDLTIDGQALHGEIVSFSTSEQSGFNVQNIAGELYLTQGALSLTNMELTTQWSSLSMPYLMLVDSRWREYKDFNTSTNLAISISGGYLSSDDVAYFIPDVLNYGVVLYNIDTEITGRFSELNAEIYNLSYSDSTHISADLSLRGLHKRSGVDGEFAINGITTNATDVSSFYASVTQQELPSDAERILSLLGQIVVRGDVTSENWQQMSVQAELESAIGDLSTDLSIDMGSDRGKSVALMGEVAASNFDLQNILQGQKLGRVTLTANIDGRVGEHNDFVAQGDISSLHYNGYTFQNVYTTIDLDGDDLDGALKINDPNLKLDITAKGSNITLPEGDDTEGDETERDDTEESAAESEESVYKLLMDLHHANIKALGLNKRDTTSRLTAKVEAAMRGRDIEDGELYVLISEGEYSYNSKRITTGEASLVANSSEGSRRIRLNSDFLDVEFDSKSRVSQLKDYLYGMVIEYLPALYDDSQSASERFLARRVSDNEDGSLSTLKITTHNIAPITDAASMGLEMAEGSELLFSFNDADHLFDLDFRSEFIERDAFLAIGINSTISNRSDSLLMSSSFDEVYLGRSQLRGTRIEAGAKNDDISFNGYFTNPQDSISVNLHSLLRLRVDGEQRRELSAKLLPSKVTQRGRVWSLDTNTIDLSRRGVRIDNFTAKSRNQLLQIDGFASHNQSDTLRLEMANFDLSTLSPLVSRLGYSLGGRTSGALSMTSALNDVNMQAHLSLDSIAVNSIAAPSMELDMQWNTRKNQARLILEDRESRDTLIRGYYIPSQVKYYARCEVDNLNIGLLDAPLGGVITDTEGSARLNLTLAGERREAELSGEIEVSDLLTTVDYTGVRYNVPRATISVSENRILSRGAAVSDLEGGAGLLDLDVNLQNLSNIKYSLKILPSKMLVLNTTERDNEMFYGRVIASGMAMIDGDKRGVRMNIAASSDGDSHFYMPLTSSENVSNADFITFVKPTVADSLSGNSVLSRRRRNYEQRMQDSDGAAMSINMTLDVRPDTEVQLVIDPTVGDIIKARGEGQLNLNLEPKANKFEIYGDYTISEGSYLFTLQNIVNKRFVIDPNSSIQWTGSPTDARLNIAAIYKLKASLQPLISDESSRAVPVDCIIKLTESLTQPDVEFSIDLPSSDGETQAMFNNLLNDQESISKQFFYLMLANSFIAESSNGGADLGASAGAATGFELLTNQLSNWLSSSNYNVIIRYRPESDLTGEELDLGFSKGLINNRLLVELEGNYVNDNTSSTSEEISNFMGEAYITWLIDRAGALRLKGFTQTIDRFDENQGLQETGVGVYYRESFDNFSDLKQKVQARFKPSEKRLAQREERKRRKKKGSKEQPIEEVAIKQEEQ